MIAIGIVRMAPALSGLVPLIIIVIGAAWERRRQEQRFRSPQKEKLLRPPGHSLAVQLDDLVFRTVYKILASFGLCAMAVAILENSNELSPIVCLGLVVAFAGLFLALRVVMDLRKGWSLRLGLRGEQAVAEALQDVADCGFRAFHDFPAGENWNIDHVLVGPLGVFVLETKARSRRQPRPGQRQPAHTVRVADFSLHFPSGNDSRSIPQAEENAKWLADYLTKMTGENVVVGPIVVLPGWFVENTEPRSGHAQVMNAKYLTNYVRKRERSLENNQVRRIVALLDEKCRDVDF